jgi:DNA replication protein DnaC
MLLEPARKGQRSRFYGGDVLVPCPDCDTGRAARERHLHALDGMREEQLLMSFANYDPEPNGAALNAVRWATQVHHGMIALIGGYGRGKTHLLSASINAVRAAGVLSAYVTMPELLRRVQNGYNTHSDVLQRYIDLPVLALDEYGRQAANDWGKSQLFQLLDGRYLGMRDRLTLIASNDDLDTWPDYLRSRLRDRRCQVICMVGGDVRGRMEWEH